MSESTINQFHTEVNSVAMFECLNRYIGYEKEIELRRCSAKMEDIIKSEQKRHHLNSGSYAEGFRLNSSDRDIMFLLHNRKAVCDINKINIQNDANVFLMDTRQCRPGLCLLKVMIDTDGNSQQFVTFRDSIPYLDASKYRNVALSLGGTVRIHGPCFTTTNSLLDYDMVCCIDCDNWPTQASEFITRCTRHHWPSVSVLDEIVQNGCHLVPVGAKKSETENLEWRISFSMAEKKLIFTFNHTQFLCYGLLKLVLSEVINKETTVSDLLCSYFLKTAVFWEMQQHNQTLWQPGNILTCFWNCFDRLISWVSSDYCPNFFIPENNMFFGKFTVKQKRSDLVNYLQTLRNEGTRLFYRIPNLMCVQITDAFTPVNPMYTRYWEYFAIDIEINKVVHDCSSDKLRSLFVKCLSYKQQNTDLAPAVVLDITLDGIVATLLLREVNDFINSIHIKTKDRYKIYRSRRYPYMRYLSSSSPCSRLYLATVLYKLGQYNTVLDIVTNVQTKIHRVDRGYSISLDDPELRKHLCLYLFFTDEDQVNELLPELQSTLQQGVKFIVPPLFYSKWLIFMCHHHIKNKYKCKQALEALHMLLFDDGSNIDDYSKDLTYSMVGMCYELYGDYQQALLMYRISMKFGGHHCTVAACRLERLENRLTISS